MLDTWDKLQVAYKRYLCNGDGSFYKMGRGYTIFSPGYEFIQSNVMFIDESVNDINLFNKTQFNSMICSTLFARKKIEEFSNEIDIKFISKALIMTKNYLDISYNAKINDNFKIIKLQHNLDKINDFIQLESNIKNISQENLLKTFNRESINREDFHIYIAYVNDSPVGTISCITIENSAIAISTSILENFRNTGVLTSLAEYAMQDSIQYQINYYTCMIMSPYTQKVLEKQGYQNEMLVDMWYYKNN